MAAVSVPLAMKLTAARWILADIWRCWQHNLTQRMRNLLVTAGIA